MSIDPKKVAYATDHTPDVHEAAKAQFGHDVELGSGARSTHPYDPAQWEIVGHASVSRSGGSMLAVLRRKGA